MTTDQTLAAAIEQHRAGRLAEAEKLYRQVLAQRPDQTDALHLLGVLAMQVGRPQPAVELIGKATLLLPGEPMYHSNLANALTACGRPEEAIVACRRAIALRGDFAEAWNNLGNAQVTAGRHEEAVASYVKAIKLKPDLAEAHSGLGIVLGNLKQTAEAVDACRRATEIRPDFAEAWSNLGKALNADGQPELALQACSRAIEMKPGMAEAYSNLGAALCELDRIPESIAGCQRAIELSPNIAAFWSDLGKAFRAARQMDQAIAAGSRAIQLGPDQPDAHLSLGYTLLMAGQLERAWVEYDWRLKCDECLLKRGLPQPKWNGEELAGKTILLYAEQGFGDTIQFARFIPQVAARCGRVIVECHPELKRLMMGMSGIEQVVGVGEPIPATDLNCPIMSLPLSLGVRTETLAAAVPYFSGDGSRRLVEGGPHIGLAWGCKPKPEPFRAMELRQLLPLAQIPATLHSLQVGPAAGQIGRVPELKLVDHADELKDFADTAALIEALDLVITIDTSIAHLAGAMGKTVWVMLPATANWRWLMDREDSPWYPTMRLFRQSKQGDWAGVVERVVWALKERYA